MAHCDVCGSILPDLPVEQRCPVDGSRIEASGVEAPEITAEVDVPNIKWVTSAADLESAPQPDTKKAPVAIGKVTRGKK